MAKKRKHDFTRTDFDGIMLMIHEGLDGLSYRQAKKVLKVVMPEIVVKAVEGDHNAFDYRFRTVDELERGK